VRERYIIDEWPRANEAIIMMYISVVNIMIKQIVLSCIWFASVAVSFTLTSFHRCRNNNFIEQCLSPSCRSTITSYQISALPITTATTTMLMSSNTNIEEDNKDYISPMRQRPPPKGGDMAYINENILRQLRHYNEIRKVGGKDCVQDVYVRDPNTSGDNTRYWFAGKVARCTGTVSPKAAIARQINLLEEHATRIRPVELGRSFGRLEFWVAPGDTEVLTSQNDVGTRLQKVDKVVDGSDNVPLLEVGLDLSIVTNQGAGFYIIRTEDGVVPPNLIGM